jgi:hypothetical protein
MYGHRNLRLWLGASEIGLRTGEFHGSHDRISSATSLGFEIKQIAKSIHLEPPPQPSPELGSRDLCNYFIPTKVDAAYTPKTAAMLCT